MNVKTEVIRRSVAFKKNKSGYSFEEDPRTRLHLKVCEENLHKDNSEIEIKREIRLKKKNYRIPNQLSANLKGYNICKEIYPGLEIVKPEINIEDSSGKSRRLLTSQPELNNSKITDFKLTRSGVHPHHEYGQNYFSSTEAIIDEGTYSYYLSTTPRG